MDHEGGLTVAAVCAARGPCPLPTMLPADVRLGGLPHACCAPIRSAVAVDPGDLQAWAAGAKRAFLEIFGGRQALSVAMKYERVSIGEAIDKNYRSYGQHWDLSNPSTEARFVWLVRRVIDPLGMHFALPCGKWGSLGGKEPADADWRLANLTIDGLCW